jgi:hypothetical protein
MKVRWVTVRVMLNDDANDEDVIAEMDYSFDHDDILSTEIMEINEG